MVHIRRRAERVRDIVSRLCAGGQLEQAAVTSFAMVLLAVGLVQHSGLPISKIVQGRLCQFT
jgi:hypothetical protein